LLGKETVGEPEGIELCKIQELCAEIKNQLGQLAVERRFPGYEKIRQLACDSSSWTTDNAFMTPTFKLTQKKLIGKYRSLIKELYASIAAAGPPK
jgi:long-subunit acyl-CoA synthetase (AMP-forming)